MSYVRCVHNVSVEEFAGLVEAARVGGAKEACEGESGQPGWLLQKLLDSVSEETVDKKKEKKAQKAVHLVDNLPPLPAKLVEMIQEGSFVDFSWFLVLEDGPSDGEWRNYASEFGEGGPSGVGTGKKRKLWNEVPDVSWWGTCFSLFQMAWVKKEPEMLGPLMAYRETIAKMARRHQWHHVVKYDRRFRQEAAGKKDVRWGEEKVNLTLDIVYNAQQGGKQMYGGGGPQQKRYEARKKGACFRFNKANGSCSFGVQCKFAHVCSQCGGDHLLRQCRRKAGEK